MPGSRLNADVWIAEYITPYDVYYHGITRVLAYRKTAFQEMYIVETGAYGKALVLDGKWQSSTGDEFLYHEPLVQPACVCQGGPRSVLVLGGGEGATAREALRWRTVEKVVMIDIDGEVVDACREHLAEMHRGAFDDPRTEVVICDALDYLDGSKDEFDVIVSDLSDPIEEGPSFKLFTKEYFEKCRARLAPGGCFVVQAGPTAPAEMALHVRLVSTVKAVFPNVAHYVSHVPTYASPWGFIMASDSPIGPAHLATETTEESEGASRPTFRPSVDSVSSVAGPFPFDPAAVDALLAGKTTGGLRMFDGATLLALMHPPKHLRDAVAKETRVYTLADPPKFFGQGVAGARQ